MQILNYSKALWKTTKDLSDKPLPYLVNKFSQNFSKNLKKYNYQTDFNNFFNSKNEIKDSLKTYYSKSLEYKLVVSRFATGKNTWNYSQGRIYHTQSHHLIATINRNYSSFPFAFIENHINGHDYLICGEDYQGQTIIELDTGKRINYLPSAAQLGGGFCWAKIHPSPDGSLLAVEGCIWAAPYEVLIMDFSNPMQPPFPILESSDYDTFFEWIDNQSAKWGTEISWSKIYNKPETDLTIHELDKEEELDLPYEEKWEIRNQEFRWEKPSLTDSIIKQINDFAWQKKNNYLIFSDYIVMIEKLLAQTSDIEKEKIFSDTSIKEIWEWAKINQRPEQGEIS